MHGNINITFNFSEDFLLHITGYFDGYATDMRPVNWPITELSIDQNHSNLWENGDHSLMIMRQMTTKASNKDQYLAHAALLDKVGWQ